MYVITSVHYNRPEYTRMFAEALRACRGIEKYHLVCYIDPTFTEQTDKIISILESIDFCSKELKINERRLGVDANTGFALHKGFEHSDYVIHVEGDCTLCKDALEYYEYCRCYKDDPRVFTATAYTKLFHPQHREEALSAEGGVNRLIRKPTFTGVTFSIWQNRWIWCINSWIDGRSIFVGTTVVGCGWDIRMNSIMRKDRYEICPYISRANHVGLTGGFNAGQDDEATRKWYYDFTYAKITSDEFNTENIEYHE